MNSKVRSGKEAAGDRGKIQRVRVLQAGNFNKTETYKGGLGEVDSGRRQRVILQGIHFYKL